MTDDKDTKLDLNELTNLTPHAITLFDETMKPVITIKSTGCVRAIPNKISETSKQDSHGITIKNPPTYSEIDGLPMFPRPIIVSTLVAQVMKELSPVYQGWSEFIYTPSTYPSDTCRDHEGQIVGITALIHGWKL